MDNGINPKLQSVMLNTICIEPRENCRSRVSILGFASIILWLYAFYTFSNVVYQRINTSGERGFTILREGISIDLLNWIDGFLLTVFCLFLLHWFRLYLSILIYDESVDIFHTDLQRLSPCQRLWEYLFRLFAFILTLYLIKGLSGKIVNVKTLYDTIIVQGIIIYLALVVWDISMWIFLNGLTPTRKRYFITDGLGLFGIVGFYELVYTKIDLTFNLFMSALIGLWTVVLTAAFFVVYDLWTDRQEYWKHIKSYFLYFGLRCVYDAQNENDKNHRHYSDDFLKEAKILTYRSESNIECKQLTN